MINKKSFTKEWIIEVNNKLGWNRDINQFGFIEKSIVALHLIEELTKTPLKFIFKGGTSLLLLLDKVHRLSVDADIILEETNCNLDETLEKIVKNSSIIIRYEKREKTRYEKFEHYNLYFNSFADETEIEKYIKLDIYNIANPYCNLIETEITNDMLLTDGIISTVRTPDIDCILADKLTAFAPETIGIPLTADDNFRPKRVEVLKQLFDIGNLFDVAENVENIRKTYYKIAEIEIKARHLNIKVEDVINDTLKYAFIIVHNGKIEKEKYNNIAKGYFGNRGFSRYVSDFEYSTNDAILSASKAIYLMKMLQSNINLFEKYDNDIWQLSKWEFKQKNFNNFNDFKFTNLEAFYYLYKALN